MCYTYHNIMLLHPSPHIRNILWYQYVRFERSLGLWPERYKNKAPAPLLGKIKHLGPSFFICEIAHLTRGFEGSFVACPRGTLYLHLTGWSLVSVRNFHRLKYRRFGLGAVPGRAVFWLVACWLLNVRAGCGAGVCGCRCARLIFVGGDVLLAGPFAS